MRFYQYARVQRISFVQRNGYVALRMLLTPGCIRCLSEDGAVLYDFKTVWESGLVLLDMALKKLFIN